MARRLVVAAVIASVLVIGVLVAATSCSERDNKTVACFLRAPSTYVIPADRTGRWPGGDTPPLANGTAIDARSQTFDNTPAAGSTGGSVAIKLVTDPGRRNDLCLAGGAVQTTLDPANTPWSTFHDRPVDGLEIYTAGFRLVGLTGWNEGDLVSFAREAANWSVVGVLADDPQRRPLVGASIHDDCIEDDGMNAGLIDDSLFDGCHDFLSARYGGSTTPPDGSANTVTIRHTIVRLQDMHQSYKPEKYGYDHNGGWFKWPDDPATDGVPPHLDVQDSIFRADKAPASYGTLDLPAGSTCHDVTIVWLGAGPFPGLASWASQCSGLAVLTGSTPVNGVAVWNDAVSSWLAAHPEMG